MKVERDAKPAQDPTSKSIQIKKTEKKHRATLEPEIAAAVRMLSIAPCQPT